MRTLLCVLLLSLAACPMDYGMKPLSDMSVDQCNTLCDTEYLNYEPPDTCSMVCGVGQLGTSLGTVPGGTCNYGVVCGGVDPTCQQITTCIAAFECCVNTSGDFDACLTNYNDCVHDDGCNTTYQQCLEDAQVAYDNCDPNTTDCAGTQQAQDDTCECQKDQCLANIQTTDCIGLERLIPPTQTGPDSYTVTRRFLDIQIGRRSSIAAETFAWPVPNLQHTAWTSMVVASIDFGEPLRALGIRNGDHILAINGMPIIAALGNPQYLLSLRNTANVSVDIRRGGVAHTLQYHIVP